MTDPQMQDDSVYHLPPDLVRQHKARFAEFLNQNYDYGHGLYSGKIERLLDNNDPCKRLVVHMDDLRAFQPDLAADVLRRPNEYLMPFEEALKDHVEQDLGAYKTTSVDVTWKVGIEGSLGANHVGPRSLTSRLLTQLVAVDGIVTKASLVRPKVMQSVHYCAATDQTSTQTYHDATGPTGVPSHNVYPTRDANGNLLTTEFGLSSYKDTQTLSIQEMPERAPPGQLPRSVDVVVEMDLCDRVKPGDRVQVIGAYRALGHKINGGTTGVFRTLIIANNIRQLGAETLKPQLSDGDIRNIRQLAENHVSAKKDIVATLARSVAPSIHGHEQIKLALLLQLLSGVEKNLENGTHLRGDVNIMMIGDPSTAKSQMLRWMLKAAPLAINTTGRGSSGVGLTAAVTTDQDTGERRLEAGAMVLADRGVVCIDEFDKMSDVDRVAIHEVMEQQTVTIAKAGIHTSLNARCSVLAAANPVYGQYNSAKKPHENIALPDSLLSRFDLLFIVLDAADTGVDRKIAQHVLRLHRYRPANEEAELGLGAVRDVDSDTESDNDDGDTPMYQQYNSLLHGPRRGATSRREQLLTLKFLRKYLYFAKTRFQPRLSEEASEHISDVYAELRSVSQIKTQPVTARMLETLVRLASAHAKARLSTEVEVQDSEAAEELLRFALFHEATPKRARAPGTPNKDDGIKVKRRRVRRGGRDASDDDSGDDDAMSEDSSDDDGVSARAASTGTPSRRTPRRAASTPSGRRTSATPSAAAQREINKAVSDAFIAARDRESLTRAEFLTFLDTAHPDKYSPADVDAVLKIMEQADKVVIDRDTGDIILI